ncbi:GNAT family N-acetyltransferase [Peribacillus simplex]|uniref:GNAT family N-acetyltransferase n=2 Tax=Peribacillus TaxID=2675229 RepID=A0AA90T1C5_9BACI|nr:MULTISPECIES: GNAT family N-acetyltransferase [Peribacillus]MDP1419248.1 GNAT family N-acetyltransferase [Peribacillus simplex]MDP1452114.1 GNAT family N-acetyltransferase [Peribacillus frigoritolerans]
MGNLSVTSFKPESIVSGFSCGNDNIDYILKNYAAILLSEGKANTNLFFLNGQLVGFCTLLADRISKSNTRVFLQGEFPTYYPAVQLYSIGVQKEYQEFGIGSQILEWVIANTYHAKKQIGISFIVLEAYKDEKLLNFYGKNGFSKWAYLEENDSELVPMVYDFRGLDGII